MVAWKLLISNEVLSLEMLFPSDVREEKKKRETVWKWSFYPYVTKFILQRYKLGGLLAGSSSRPEQKMQDTVGASP